MSKFQGLNINPLHMPSRYQEELWGHYIIVEDGTDQEGNWHGRCPLHTASGVSALFNFQSGVLVCLGEPSCHEGKRAISLTNVLTRMTQT